MECVNDKEEYLMMDNKKMAIICWVLSFLFMGGAVLMYEGQFTTKLFFDCLLSVVWLYTGFCYWKRRKKEDA